MDQSPYNYSKDAKLRISIINNYWKMSAENKKLVLKMIGKTEESKFSGFSLIDYHSFVAPPDNKGKLKLQTPLTDVKFKFNSCGKPRKMGRPPILLQTTSEYHLKPDSVFAHIDKEQDIFLLTYVPTCAAPIITLIVSDYLFSVLLDDINLGKQIQLFDICLKTEGQKYPNHSVSSRSHKHFEGSLPHELSFKEDWSGMGTFIGKVTNHCSVTLEEFHQMAGYDYVLEQTKKNYFDPDHHEHLKKHWSFDEYLQRQREIYSKPLGP
jgi:hypothetical protein